MSEKAQISDRQLENYMKDLRREVRRTRDLAGRATVMAGLGLILSIMIFAVALVGLDGLRENMKLLATATPEDMQEAGETVIEESNLGLEEAGRLAGNLPEIHIDEWHEVLDD